MKFIGFNKYFVVLLSCTLLILYGLNSLMHVKAKDVDINTILKNIETNLNNTNISEGTSNDIKRIYGINPSSISDAKIFVAKSNMKADQLLILRVENNDDVDPILEKLQVVLKKQSDTFKDYEPIQYDLLENKILLDKGKYIFLFVGEDSEVILNAFKNSFK